MRGELSEAPGMESVEEADVTRAQEVLVNELSGVRRHGHVFPHVRVLVLWVRNAHDNVLDTDTELSLLVVARLVRYAHALDELHGVATAHSIGALVAVEIGTDSVASSMTVVEANFPEVLSSKDIHIPTSDRTVLRPDKTLEVDDTKQDAGVGFLLEGGRWGATKVRRTSGIGCTVQVLTT